VQLVEVCELKNTSELFGFVGWSENGFGEFLRLDEALRETESVGCP
jgi:hypothetical protein